MVNFSNQPTDPEMKDMINFSTDNSPQEAVKVIDRANHYHMHPDEYDEMKDVLDPEAIINERVPAQVHPTVKSYASKSSNNAKVVEDEIGVLDYLGRQFDFAAYQLYGKRDSENMIEELQLEQYENKGLPKHKKEILDFMIDERTKKIESFELEGYEQVFGQAVGLAGDVAEAIGENKALISAATGAGLAAGLWAKSPLTAVGGTLAGLGYGVTGALMVDAFRRITVATYDDLTRMTDDQGQPLNLSENTKTNLSTGLGIVSAGLEAVTGRVLTKGLGKLVGRKPITNIVKNTSLRSAIDILGHAARTGFASGGEEFTSELAAIFTENLAKAHDSEDGLLNALNSTYNDIKDKPAVRQRLGMSAAVGALGGGGIAAGTGVAAAPRIKKTYDAVNAQIKASETYEVELEKQRIQQKVVNDAVQSLANQDFMTELSNTSLETNLKKMSPEQMSEFRKNAFSQAGYQDKIWFSEADILTIEEKNPELAAQIRTMDITEASRSDSSAPVSIEPHRFLDLVDDFPTVSEYARLNPEAPNPLESKNLLERFSEAQTKRQEIFESLGVDEELSPEQVQTLQELDAMVEEGSRVAGQQAYIDEAVTFTKNIEGVISDTQVENFNKAQRKAREDVADQMIKEFEADELRQENKTVELNKQAFETQQREKLQNDLRVVNLYKPDLKAPKPEGHKRKGHSVLGIDPESLPADLKEAYITDPKLKGRKVFVEGGITLVEAADLAGVENGEVLLNMLANTPTKQEMLAERKANAKRLRQEVKEARAVDLDTRRDKIFDNISKLHKKEMEFMRKAQWPATKQGLRKIMLPLPNIPEIRNEAKKVVSRTRVKALNPRQFNAAEKSLQKKAATHILKNEVEQAFVTKEKAIKNTELTRESLRARKQINDAKVVVRRVTSKKGINTFKNAGLLDEANEIFSLFDLLGSEPKARKQDAYIDYLTSLGDESIIVPEPMADVRQIGRDLTVEQYLRVTDRLKTLEHQAKTENKLLKRQKQEEEFKKIQTEEAVVTEAVLDLRENPNFSEAKLREVKNKNSKSSNQKDREVFGLIASWQTNLKNIATELDQEHLGGLHYNNIAQPMVDGETFKRHRTSEVVGHIKKITEDYGVEDYVKAFNQEIFIPEFEGFEHLGNGVMLKSDLWTLLAYLGDPDTKQRIVNFKNPLTEEAMDVDTVQRVLDRELNESDAKLSQNFVNIFKSFTEEAKALHERTTGVTPNMIEGVPITHRGKVSPGGYVPANLLATSPTERASRFLEIVGAKEASMFGAGKQDNKLYSRLRSAEMTDQGRLIDRKNSTRPLDLDFANFIHAYEEHIHDLAYREVGTDVLKLLRNTEYSNAIISTVGQSKYNTMVGGVIETVGKGAADDILNPFGSVGRDIMKGYKYLEQGFNIGVLGFSPSSVAMQPLSLGSAKLRMGKKGTPYIAKALGQSVKHLTDGTYQEMFDRAAEINPDLRFNQDSVDDTLVKSAYGDILPKRVGRFKGETFDLLRKGRDHLNDMAMMGLKSTDVHIKAAVTMASYTQFLDGNVKNFPQSRLNKMTDAEITVEAKKYAKQVADLALTTTADIDKSAVEKVAFMRPLTRFYTDLRSQQNTAFSEVRKVRNAAKRAINEGQTFDKIPHVKEAAFSIGSLVTVHALSQAYMGMVQKREVPLEDLGKVNSMDDFYQYMGGATLSTLGAPVKGVIGSTIGFRDIEYSLGGFRRKKTVSYPVNQIFGDMVTGVSGLTDLIKGRSLNKDQKKALAFDVSYAIGGLPVNGPLKILKLANETGIPKMAAGFLKKELTRLGDTIDEYIDLNKNNPKEQETIRQLKNVKTELIPAVDQAVNNVIPEDSLEVLKLNEWDDLNPITGAAGIYQFTPERWEEISNANPDLDLTDNGRVSKDTSEQEKAMEWENEENAKGLIAYLLKVDNANLYGTHRFGLDDYVAVLTSNADEKLTDVVGDMTLFEGFETVKQVKSYVNKQVNKK